MKRINLICAHNRRNSLRHFCHIIMWHNCTGIGVLFEYRPTWGARLMLSLGLLPMAYAGDLAEFPTFFLNRQMSPFIYMGTLMATHAKSRCPYDSYRTAYQRRAAGSGTFRFMVCTQIASWPVQCLQAFSEKFSRYWFIESHFNSPRPWFLWNTVRKYQGSQFIDRSVTLSQSWILIIPSCRGR